MAYRHADRKDRWKAIAAVAGVHLALGAVILSGLNVEIVGKAIDRLETFDIALEKPRPEEPPEPVELDSADEAEGAAGSEPSPIVAPEPEVRVPTRQPVVAAPEAGSGSSDSAGSGDSGRGPGAGGAGTGPGGGGSGAGGSPPRLVRNLGNSDYRALTSGRMRSGSAGLALTIGASGRVESCRIAHSSGDPVIDGGLCPLVSARLRFEPARDPSGRPVPYSTHYRATWRR